MKHADETDADGRGPPMDLRYAFGPPIFKQWVIYAFVRDVVRKYKTVLVIR